jgi:hypothetical protein
MSLRLTTLERRRKATTFSLIQKNSSHKLIVQTPMRANPLNLRHRHATNSALTVFAISLLLLVKVKSKNFLHQIENRQVKEEKGNNKLITILNMLF